MTDNATLHALQLRNCTTSINGSDEPKMVSIKELTKILARLTGIMGGDRLGDEQTQAASRSASLVLSRAEGWMGAGRQRALGLRPRRRLR